MFCHMTIGFHHLTQVYSYLLRQKQKYPGLLPSSHKFNIRTSCSARLCKCEKKNAFNNFNNLFLHKRAQRYPSLFKRCLILFLIQRKDAKKVSSNLPRASCMKINPYERGAHPLNVNILQHPL